MAKTYLFIVILCVVWKCSVLQASNSTVSPEFTNSTVKDPGIAMPTTAAIPTSQPLSTASTTISTTAASTDSDKLKQTAINILYSLKTESADESTTPTTSSSPNNLTTTTTPLVESNRRTHKRPDTCGERMPSSLQPVQDELSMIRKCCPYGESFNNENFTEQPRDCVETDVEFSLKPIVITLYDSCIEDNETMIEMDFNVGNMCNRSVHYSEMLEDRMFVIQNGSLLIMDINGTVGFSIHDDYCIDINAKTGKYDAIVCVSPPVAAKVGKAKMIFYSTMMFVSIPCLFFVTFIHFAIDELNHMHGILIGSMSFCLGMGFTLHCISQFSAMAELRLQYAVQYFILAYYMWIFILCLNLVLFLWIYVLHYVNLRRRHRTGHLVIYCCIAFLLPIVPVILTRLKRIPGMPSYFQQAWSEYTVSAIRLSQRYFIPPVSTVLAVCFVLLVIAYFGFRKLDEILNARDNVSYQLVVNGRSNHESFLPKIDRAFAQQVQLNARCLALLYAIVVVTWIFEVVTFYNPGAGDYLVFLEVMNSLQGVFILIIFVIVRNKRQVIVRWWHDRGSHNISEGTELQMMNNNKNAGDKGDDIEK